MGWEVGAQTTAELRYARGGWDRVNVDAGPPAAAGGPIGGLCVSWVADSATVGWGAMVG